MNREERKAREGLTVFFFAFLACFAVNLVSQIFQPHCVGRLPDYKKDIYGSGVINRKGNIEFGEGNENWQAVANATYGIYAAEVGIPQKFAEFGAGVTQLIQDPKTRGRMDTFGDDPYDNYWIKFGYAFQNDYSSKSGSLTPEDLKTGIKNNTFAKIGKPIFVPHIWWFAILNLPIYGGLRSDL